MASVLVVDDDTKVRRSFSGILRDVGFQVRVARSGREAIRKQTETPSSVMLIDMKMPRLSGIDTAREIRQFDTTVEMIAVTGYAPDYQPHAKGLGIERWVPKPIISPAKKSLLVQAVREGVSQSHAKVLSTDLRHLAEQISRDNGKELVKRVRQLIESLPTSDQEPVGVTPSDYWYQISKFSLLLATAVLIRESKVGAKLFSQTYFSEVENAPQVQETLQKVRVARIAARYEDDLKNLMALTENLK